MKWNLRKSHKRDEVPEFKQFLDFQEPRKSILRAKRADKDNSSLENGEFSGNMASFADIRSASSSKPNALHSTNWAPPKEIPVGLRSVDNRRRNVLFLDQVERSKRPSVTELPISRSQASSPASSSNAYASYPTSYQPSPLFPKRDFVNCDIELVSRAPLSPAESDNTNDSHVSPRLKRWLRMSSFNQRWKQKHLDYYQSDDAVDGLENELPMTEALRRYPTTAEVGSTHLHSTEKQTERNPHSAGMQNINEVARSDLQSADTNSPVVRRPVRPTIVETQKPFVVYDGLKSCSPRSSVNSDNGITSNVKKSFYDASKKQTDSTVTLQPQTRQVPSYEAPRNSTQMILHVSPSMRSTYNNNISSPASGVSLKSSASQSTQITPSPRTFISAWSTNKPVNNFVSPTSEYTRNTNCSSTSPSRSPTKVVYVPDAFKRDTNLDHDTRKVDWRPSEVQENNPQWKYKPVSSNSVVIRSYSVSQPGRSFRL